MAKIYYTYRQVDLRKISGGRTPSQPLYLIEAVRTVCRTGDEEDAKRIINALNQQRMIEGVMEEAEGEEDDE